MLTSILLSVVLLESTQLIQQFNPQLITIKPTSTQTPEKFTIDFYKIQDRQKLNRSTTTAYSPKSNNTPTITPAQTLIPIPNIQPIIMTITAYTINECDKSPKSKLYGVTASGKRVQANYTIAMGRSYRFGTKVKIQGFGDTVFVNEDRGGAITDGIIDLYVSSYKEAVNYGRQKRKVWILN